jgi:hypothetical protein
MTDDGNLLYEDLDVDGALEETAQVLPSATRRSLLRGALVGGAALLAELDETPLARASGIARTKRDISILQFDLVLEYLQAGLYTEAERLGALPEKTLAWARVVGAHERAHVKAIKNLLGPRAVQSPSFNYRSVTEDERAFTKTAVAFEELTAALLKWQAVRLDSREILAAAATLHTVETRHAAWIRRIVGLRPAARAFDEPAPQRQMSELIKSTRFVVSPARTSHTKRKPPYTG